MPEGSVRDESLLFQWNFFERAISNYSIIVKMFQYMEGEKDLTAYMPRVFVEETVFDACEVVMRGGGRSFFAIDAALKRIGCEEIEKPKGVIFSPSVFQDIFGYGTLYVYPLKRSIHVFGYLVLGKKSPVTLDETTLRDLDLLSEILNRFILLNMQVRELKAVQNEKVRDLDSRLAATRTLLDSVIDQFPHPLFMIDRNGTICFANKGARDEFFEGNGFPSGEPLEECHPGHRNGLSGQGFDAPGRTPLQERSRLQALQRGELSHKGR